MKRRVSLMSTVVLCVMLTGAAFGAASRTGSGHQQAGSGSAGFRIALIPLNVDGGRGTAKESLPGVYKQVFEEEGFDVTMGQPVEAAMSALGIRVGGMPTQQELLRIGKKLGVDYVLAADIKVDTKRVWVMLVPKAKSTVTIDTVIVNVKQGRIVYDPKEKVGVSQGGSDLQTGVGWVISDPVALFMGGSRSQEERKAAANAVETTYADFFDSLSRGR